MRKVERLAARFEAKGGGSAAESDDSEDTEDRFPMPSRESGRRPRIEQHQLTPEERATLIALFEDLLFKTRRL